MHSLLQSVGLSNKPNPDLVGFFKQQCFLCSHLCTVIMDISFPLHLPQLGLLEALYPLQPGTLLACLWVANTEQPGKGTSTPSLLSVWSFYIVFPAWWPHHTRWLHFQSHGNGRKCSCHVVSHDRSHCSVIFTIHWGDTGSRRGIRHALLGGRVPVYLI